MVNSTVKRKVEKDKKRAEKPLSPFSTVELFPSSIYDDYGPRLINHYIKYTYRILASDSTPTKVEIWRSKVPKLMKSSSLITECILSFTSLHLWILEGNCDNELESKSSLHYSNSLKLCGKELSKWTRFDAYDCCYKQNINEFQSHDSLKSQNINNYNYNCKNESPVITSKSYEEIYIAAILILFFTMFHPNLIPLVSTINYDNNDYNNRENSIDLLKITQSSMAIHNLTKNEISKTIFEDSLFDNGLDLDLNIHVIEHDHMHENGAEFGDNLYLLIPKELIKKLYELKDQNLISKTEFEINLKALNLLINCIKENKINLIFKFLFFLPNEFSNLARKKKIFSLILLSYFANLCIIGHVFFTKDNNIWNNFLIQTREFLRNSNDDGWGVETMNYIDEKIGDLPPNLCS